MLKYINYNIVFQEVPNETTLAINLSRCPNKCKGCHSTDLQKDIGEVLDDNIILELLQKYQCSVTCICFMGGDNAPQKVAQLAALIKRLSLGQLKTAWYSGKSHLPTNVSIEHLNFIKLGDYVEKLGALDSPTTNQRFYEIVNGKLINNTQQFLKRELSVVF